MQKETNESLDYTGIARAIELIQEFNSKHLATSLVLQLRNQVKGTILPGADLLATYIDEISDTQYLVNQVNELLNPHGVSIKLISIGNIRIPGGISTIKRIFPFISDVSKFERFITENQNEGKLLVGFIADSIMEYGINAELDIYHVEVINIESDALLFDTVSIFGEMDTIPDELGTIVERYKQG